MIVRNATQGKKVNLYDSEKHQHVSGVLFFRPVAQDSQISETLVDQKEEISSTETISAHKEALIIRFSFWVDHQVFVLVDFISKLINLIIVVISDAWKILPYLLETDDRNKQVKSLKSLVHKTSVYLKDIEEVS